MWTESVWSKWNPNWSLLVEALVLRVVEGGVPFEEGDDPGVIIIREGGGEFAGLIRAERGVGVREVQGRTR